MPLALDAPATELANRHYLLSRELRADPERPPQSTHSSRRLAQRLGREAARSSQGRGELQAALLMRSRDVLPNAEAREK